jgi:hypothetical protein
MEKEPRQSFIEKQKNAFDGWMKGDMFMPADGVCWHCNDDIIAKELERGNDGTQGVIGCSKCFHSYCD